MGKKPKVSEKKLTDYVPNESNHNQGTERGAQMLETSFNKYGAGRSLLADKKGKLIAGNQSLQAAIDAGLVNAVEIETDGHTVVVVKRNDLDLDAEEDTKAIELAYMDNRAHEISFRLDVDQIAADVNRGVDFSSMYTPGELGLLINVDIAEPTVAEMPQRKISEQYVLIVECSSEQQQALLFAELNARGLKCRALLS